MSCPQLGQKFAAAPTIARINVRDSAGAPAAVVADDERDDERVCERDDVPGARWSSRPQPL